MAVAARDSRGYGEGPEEALATQRFFELSILRAHDNVRIAVLLLLLVVTLTSPVYVVSRPAVYVSLFIGVLLTLWTRFAARWRAMRAAGQMRTAAVVVLLGDFTWLALLVYGTGGLSSPFSALLLIPVIFASAFFSLLRLAAALVTGLVVMANIAFAVSRPVVDIQTPWRLTGTIFAIIAIAWVSYGLSLVLERERRTNELVVHHLSEGVMLVDASGLIRLVNSELERLTDLPAAEMMLLNVRDLAGKPEYAKLAGILSDVLAPPDADLSIVRDLTLETPEPTDLRITTVRLGGRGTRPTGWLVVCQDVTELKSLVRMRESGIRFLSHEMRSPLTTFKLISSVFQELADRLSDNRSAKLIEIVDNETDRMLRLVGKFLDVAALDEGSYQPGKEPCDVARLAARVGDAIEVRGAEKGVAVSTRCAEELPPIQANPDDIEDVLYNLCDNALKHTEQGGSISIEVAREDGFVTIAVSDTGCGIPEDAQERIFEEFAQVHDARAGTALERGVGLGLYTVRRIVEIHGGRVEVDSEVGRGSTFRVYLPITREEG